MFLILMLNIPMYLTISFLHVFDWKTFRHSRISELHACAQSYTADFLLRVDTPYIYIYVWNIGAHLHDGNLEFEGSSARSSPPWDHGTCQKPWIRRPTLVPLVLWLHSIIVPKYAMSFSKHKQLSFWQHRRQWIHCLTNICVFNPQKS